VDTSNALSGRRLAQVLLAQEHAAPQGQAPEPLAAVQVRVQHTGLAKGLVCLQKLPGITACSLDCIAVSAIGSPAPSLLRS
jgi:hypothetical protein